MYYHLGTQVILIKLCLDHSQPLLLVNTDSNWAPNKSVLNLAKEKASFSTGYWERGLFPCRNSVANATISHYVPDTVRELV